MAGLIAPEIPTSAAGANEDNDRPQIDCSAARVDRTILAAAEGIEVQNKEHIMGTVAVWFDFADDGNSGLFLRYFDGKDLLFGNHREAGFTKITTVVAIKSLSSPARLTNRFYDYRIADLLGERNQVLLTFNRQYARIDRRG